MGTRVWLYNLNSFICCCCYFVVDEDPPSSLAVETLEELEWCLERLESIQTHRSVSDMASSKVSETTLIFKTKKINNNKRWEFLK